MTTDVQVNRHAHTTGVTGGGSSGQGDDMTPCEQCGARYTSPLAAAECEEADRIEQLHAIQALRGRSKK